MSNKWTSYLSNFINTSIKCMLMVLRKEITSGKNVYRCLKIGCGRCQNGRKFNTIMVWFCTLSATLIISQFTAILHERCLSNWNLLVYWGRQYYSEWKPTRVNQPSDLQTESNQPKQDSWQEHTDYKTLGGYQKKNKHQHFVQKSKQKLSIVACDVFILAK